MNRIDNNRLMTASIENDDLVIRIPIDLLIFAQERREDSIFVTNKSEMCKDLVELILNYGGNDDVGSTAFEDFLDDFFIWALEAGKPYLEGWWEREEDEDGDK